MNGLSAEDKEAVDYLIDLYTKQKETLPTRINEYKKKLNTKSSVGISIKLNEAEKKLLELPSKLKNIQVNPEKFRDEINQIKKQISVKKANTNIYPTFPTDFTNGSSGLKRLKEGFSRYKADSIEKEEKLIKDIKSFVDLFLNRYGIDPNDIVVNLEKIKEYKYYYNFLFDIQTFFEIKETFGSILAQLQTEFPTNYSLFLNWGSGGLMSQIMPQDESFKANVLTKYPKHLFLIFDKSDEGWHYYKNLFRETPNTSNKTNPHTSRIQPIKEYLGVDAEYTKLSEKAFQYVFRPIINGVSTEIRLVFLDSYISNFGFYALEPLIQNASLRIATCTSWPSCDVELLENYKYILNHFDYYMTQWYSTNPIFNIKGKGEDKRFIIDLESIRSKKLSKNNIYSERIETSVVPPMRLMFNSTKMNSKGVTYKRKGNTQYWNIIRGGKHKKQTRKTKIRSK